MGHLAHFFVHRATETARCVSAKECRGPQWLMSRILRLHCVGASVESDGTKPPLCSPLRLQNALKAFQNSEKRGGEARSVPSASRARPLLPPSRECHPRREDDRSLIFGRPIQTFISIGRWFTCTWRYAPALLRSSTRCSGPKRGTPLTECPAAHVRAVCRRRTTSWPLRDSRALGSSIRRCRGALRFPRARPLRPKRLRRAVAPCLPACLRERARDAGRNCSPLRPCMRTQGA